MFYSKSSHKIIRVALLFFFCTASISFAMADDGYCSSVTYAAPSESKHNIQFVFDQQYPCGQYANGDWWVSSKDGSGVTITSILPSQVEGVHGYEVNPSKIESQGFDKRISGYDKSLAPSLPLLIKGDASVVKAVSVFPTESKCRPCLQFAAVLTVVQSPPVNSIKMLRPAYFGKNKRPYLIPDNYLDNLVKYPGKLIGFAEKIDMAKIAKRFREVQLDHLVGWPGRAMHPIDNLPDYGAQIATDNGVAVLHFLLDDRERNEKDFRQAMIAYLQMGMDLQAMAIGGVKWLGRGGHGNGRKLPIIFFEHISKISLVNKLSNQPIFSEDEQVYISPKTGMALFGSPCADHAYWMTIRKGKGARDCRDPYGYIDGGGPEIGDGYQSCCTAMPWKYTALAVHLLGAQNAWSNDAFLEYVDRWVNAGALASPDPCAPYNNNPDDYGKSYGPDGAMNCIRGTGRYKDRHGINKDGGHYRSPLGDQMWRKFRNYSAGLL